MSNCFVTQCPQCRTSFRVSQVQLSAAQGTVRCGACLHVFNAHQHLLSQPETVPAATAVTGALALEPSLAASAGQLAASVSANTPPRGSLDSAWIHDDLDLDSFDLDEELARLELEEQNRSRSLPAAAEADKPNATTPPSSLIEASLAEAAAKPWTQQQLEVSPPEKAEQPASASPLMPEPEASSDTQSSALLPLAEPATDAEPTAKQAETAAPLADSQPTVEEAEEIQLSDSDTDAHPIDSFKADANLYELNEDPLQLQWHSPGKPWGRWLGWGLLNLLAAGGLLVQYSLYNFDELARQDKYRTWFERICPQLGCSLPPKVDVNLIRSSNLVVRSHPDFAGALVVDAMLYNRASFAQPFPLLELRFSDINDKPLANRRFKPREYLAGELAGQSQMPPQTPIHISLDILDPGQEAVNYSLNFQSPE